LEKVSDNRVGQNDLIVVPHGAAGNRRRWGTYPSRSDGFRSQQRLARARQHLGGVVLCRAVPRRSSICGPGRRRASAAAASPHRVRLAIRNCRSETNSHGKFRLQNGLTAIPSIQGRPNRSDTGFSLSCRAIMAYLPPILRGNSAMPLLRAAAPLQRRQSERHENRGSRSIRKRIARPL